MSEQKKYHSAFKRVCVTDDGGKKIKELQEEFDKFWRKMHKFADKSPEKFHAQKAMQEACMWLSRGCALKHERVPEIIIDDEPKHEYQKTLAQTLERYQSGDRIQVKNRPTIILKKK